MTAVRARRSLEMVVAAVLAALLALALAILGSAAPSTAAAGEISGQVVDPTLAGLDGLTVIIDDGSDPPAYQTVTTSGGGYFSYAPPADGDYDVIVLGGADHLDYDSGPFTYELATPTSGDLGQIVLDPGKRITGVVRDASTGVPIEGVIVLATDPTFTDIFPALPPTDSTGEYSVAVPPGGQYYLVALDGSLFGSPGDFYDPQFWDHVNFSTTSSCSCIFPGTPLNIDTTWPGTPVTDIDFDLLSYADWIYFSVYAQRLPVPTEYPGVTILLDKWDAGTSSWDLGVASDVTDSDGFADLFGLGAGDYRIRYTVGGVAVAVVSYDDFSGGPFPLYDGGTSVEFPTLYPTSPGCGCGGSFFEQQDIDLTFPAASGGSSGGGGGGGGGGTPGGRPGGGTSGTPTLTTPTATPTPTPTPTSSPSPTSSPTSAPSPTPTEPPVDPQNSADLWWLWLILAILVALILFFIGRALLRR